MTTRFLLDTNIVSDLVRNPQGRAAAKIAEVGEDAVATSIIVAAELRYGAARKASPRLSSQVDAVLGAFEVIALDAPADVSNGAVRVALEAAGTPIGGNDLLIAAQALALDMVLVTDNEREFQRVAGLKIENWLRQPTVSRGPLTNVECTRKRLFNRTRTRSRRSRRLP